MVRDRTPLLVCFQKQLQVCNPVAVEVNALVRPRLDVALYIVGFVQQIGYEAAKVLGDGKGQPTLYSLNCFTCPSEKKKVFMGPRRRKAARQRWRKRCFGSQMKTTSSCGLSWPREKIPRTTWHG